MTEATTPSEVLDRVSTMLDGQYTSFRQGVLEEIARLLLDREKQIEELIQRLREAVTDRDATAAASAELTTRNAVALEAVRSECSALETALCKSVRKRRDDAAARECIRAWRESIGNRGTATRHGRYVAARRCFSAWRVESAVANCEREWRAKTEELGTKMVQRYESELGALRRQLVESRAESQRMQDELKRALVRGVCALNSEAMSAFRATATTAPTTRATFQGEEMPMPSEFVPLPTPQVDSPTTTATVRHHVTASPPAPVSKASPPRSRPHYQQQRQLRR